MAVEGLKKKPGLMKAGVGYLQLVSDYVDAVANAKRDGKLVLNTAPLPPDRSGEMVIACMHGQRAWLAKKLLALHGYRNTAFIEGWLQDWIKAGLPWDRPAS
jgi:rhodanese-related sulfurtransferase